MLNGLQASFQAPLNGMLAVAQHGAFSLFFICWIASTPFLFFAIIGAIQNGGGAGLIQTIGLRITILAATLALVTYWVPFAQGLEADINNFGAALAHTTATPVDFTPDGVDLAFSNAGDIIKKTGDTAPFAVLDAMNIWKAICIGIVSISGVGCAVMLLLANISFALVLAIGSVCVGLVSSPWLKGFLDQFIRVLVGAAIFAFGVAIFVGIGTTFASSIVAAPGGTYTVSADGVNPFTGEAEITAPVGPAAVPMSGKTMMDLSADVFFCFVLSLTVPATIASRIAGGGILTGIGDMLSFMKGRF
jgi:hypothetical protein